METNENKTYAREDKRNKNILYRTCAVPRREGGCHDYFLPFAAPFPLVLFAAAFFLFAA
jgi:hypothetical protein